VNLAEAAEAFIDAKARQKAANADLAEPERVLKDYFRESGKTVYKGLVAYQCSTFMALDTTLAKELLGKTADDAMVERTRETLVPLKAA
jgi:hypothetical protein